MDAPGILIVDDEKETRNTIGAFLKARIKCDIHEADNGKKALEVLKDNKCDIMVLDIRMPKKSGIHVLDEMESRVSGVDVIVVTAWDSEVVAEECAKRNVECIPKPVSVSELYEKIVKLLKKRGKFIPRKNS